MLMALGECGVQIDVFASDGLIIRHKNKYFHNIATGQPPQPIAFCTNYSMFSFCSLSLYANRIVDTS